MSKDLKVSHIQIRGLIVSSVIGVGILSLPNILTILLGKDGWIAILTIGLISIPLLWVINQVFKENPGKDFFQIGRETLGKPIFNLLLVSLFGSLLLYCASLSRILGEMVKAFLLPNTPVEVIIIVFILATSYIATYEIDVICRAGYFMYPIIIGFALIFVLLALPTADFTNILPAFQGDLTNLPKGILNTFFSFAGFELIIFAVPYAEDKKEVLKSSMLAILTITIIYLSLFFITLTQFTVEEIQNQIFPVLIIAKNVDLPGYFLQNLDGFVVAIWVLVIFSSVGPSYYGSGKILSEVFSTKSHKNFIWLLAPVIYFIATMPENMIQMERVIGRIRNILGIISIIVVPALIYIVGILRRRLSK